MANYPKCPACGATGSVGSDHTLCACTSDEIARRCRAPAKRPMTDKGYASDAIYALANRPMTEKAARALATADRGHDDDYWLYDEEVAIVLRETGAIEIIKALLDTMAPVWMDQKGRALADAKALLAEYP